MVRPKRTAEHLDRERQPIKIGYLVLDEEALRIGHLVPEEPEIKIGYLVLDEVTGADAIRESPECRSS